MIDRLMRQIDVHRAIDAILAAGPEEDITVQSVKSGGTETNHMSQSQPKLSAERVRELIDLQSRFSPILFCQC